jgi:H+-translocating diphosphatase
MSKDPHQSAAELRRDSYVTLWIMSSSAIALGFAAYQLYTIAQTKLDKSYKAMKGTSVTSSEQPRNDDERSSLTTRTRNITSKRQLQLLCEIHDAISTGAEAFLTAEYSVCAVFVAVFSIVIFGLVSFGQSVEYGFLTTVAFVLGGITSIACGYVGTRVAVFSNVRTTINAQKPGYDQCFNTAFRSGSVMGFFLVGLGVLVVYVLLLAYATLFGRDNWVSMMDCMCGYGLGASTIALFGRVGGGIFTKAADVGADMVKLNYGITEDDARNPAVIADNVGDNVGDVAGAGADLFGSFAESVCAAFVLAAQIPDLRWFGWSALCFPLILFAVGIISCLLSSFLATHVYPVFSESRIEFSLRLQLVVTALVNLPAAYFAAGLFLPNTFHIDGINKPITATRHDAVVCVFAGSMGGLIIGLCTEYYTSKRYSPVQGLVAASEKGAAITIINALALGYQSTIAPVFVLAAVSYISFTSCDMYGLSLASVGMLANLATTLTIDAYGPVVDNAGGIAGKCLWEFVSPLIPSE